MLENSIFEKKYFDWPSEDENIYKTTFDTDS